MNICKVCNSKIVNTLKVQEKHYGTFEEFEYLQCSDCHSLVIKELPSNLSQYYPGDYYSISESPPPKGLLNWIRKKYWTHIISKKSHNIIGHMINLFRQVANENIYSILERTNINTNSKILDIGCGKADLIKTLYQIGFPRVLGLDPNIQKDIYYKESKLVIKSNLENFSKNTNTKYDLIMFNHSFEHLPNPIEILQAIKKISMNSTYFLIRIPLTNSYAFKYYKENWVQLDAPRHLFLYSEKGIVHLLKSQGFKVCDIIYDSNEFQFWGSEQYLKNIPLQAKNSYSINASSSIFSKEKIHEYYKYSKVLNEQSQGDMAAFIFKIKT